MKKNFFADVIKFTPATEEQIATMSHKEIMEQFVFPHILMPTGQDTRGWRISDTYMKFAYKYADYCISQDANTGFYMLKFALNRISLGAVLHEAVDLSDLPPQYVKYGVSKDERGLLSNQCFVFLQNTIEQCLSNKLTQRHFIAILFGLIDNLSPDGDRLNKFLLGAEDFSFTGKEVYEWAEHSARLYLGFDECYEHYATPERWRKYLFFFRAMKGQINKKSFFNHIGVKGFFAKKRVWSSL